MIINDPGITSPPCRACSIKNSPLPNKFTTLEEDLLPMLPSAGGAPGLGMLQLQVRS